MVTVYNVKTGKAVTVHGVDAREYVATGGWSFDQPPVKRKRKAPVKKTK